MIGMVVHPEISSQSVAIFIRGDHSVGTFIELLGHYQCETEKRKRQTNSGFSLLPWQEHIRRIRQSAKRSPNGNA